MGFKKKHGKERLDKWYRLAKEKGYRARAAFKLIQLNRKYGFLQNSKVLLDLCSAPGSWSQVAAETMPRDSLIVGVDIVSVKPIPRTIGIQGDIMTDQCVASIQRTLKTLKADAVIHDGAPNVGTSWTHDAFSQAGLVLQATKLAAKFLRPGGIFVTKIFRSKDYNALLWILQQLFVSAEVTKPPASRNLSAEIYVTCKGFKAPKYIDPRFLDPRHVFAELSAKGHAIESKVLKPEESRRKRDGYADDEWNQFKEVPASRFIESSDTITLLATCNKFSFNQLEHGSPFLLALESLPVTSAEIKACCDDLRVLGKKDFRALLRWRARCREILSLEQEDNVPATQLETLSGNGSLRHGTETRESAQDIRRRLAAKEKKQSRKERESRRQDIQRMHLHMQTPTDIGLNQATLGDDHVASGQSNTEQQRLSGMIVRDHSIDSCVHEVGIGNSDDDSSDDDGNQLEKELDYSYEQYKARRLHPREKDKNALQEAKRSISTDTGDAASTLNFPELQGQQDSSAFFENGLIADLDGISVGELANEKSISKEYLLRTKKNKHLVSTKTTLLTEQIEQLIRTGSDEKQSSSVTLNDVNIPIESEVRLGSEGPTQMLNEGSPDISFSTPEAMTLAYQIAGHPHSKHALADDAFNRQTFQDRGNLPQWFLEDEQDHNRPILATPKGTVAQALKARQRTLNSRTTKKVLEAKQRKRLRQARKVKQKQMATVSPDSSSRGRRMPRHR